MHQVYSGVSGVSKCIMCCMYQVYSGVFRCVHLCSGVSGVFRCIRCIQVQQLNLVYTPIQVHGTNFIAPKCSGHQEVHSM